LGRLWKGAVLLVYFCALKMEAICSQKNRLIFNGLHTIIPQNIRLFINIMIMVF
jgi:hypothetical protein